MDPSYQKNCLIALFGARALTITKNLGHGAAVLVDELVAVRPHRTERRQLLQVLTGSGQIGCLGRLGGINPGQAVLVSRWEPSVTRRVSPSPMDKSVEAVAGPASRIKASGCKMEVVTADGH